MSMKNITEDLTQLVCECLQTDECLAHCNHGPCFPCQRLAGCLIENGCVLLPWKIGDVVYYISNRETIEKDIIIRLTLTKTGCNPILEKHTTGFWKHYNWFRSYEEAKDYLKLKKEKNK